MSKNNYWKVAAELVSNKEAYGAQKQALNIWLTPKNHENREFPVFVKILF